jgi:dipeptidyl aminopeptidase/acylaminoacyl peptidase
MTGVNMQRRWSGRIGALAIAVALTLVAGAQSKAPAGPGDWGQWESLVPQGRAGLSPDGRWLAYGINRSNRQNELRVTNVAEGATTVLPFGSQPAFSADSRWLAYSIGYSEAEEEKLRQQKKPIQRKLGLLDLTSGDRTTTDGVESFAFNPRGSHVALRRYPPERQAPTPAAAPSEEAGSPGATLIVRELATGRDTTFGNVSEYAWQHKGPLLALSINADDRTGNGVHLYEPSSGSLRVLDSAAAIYTALVWRRDADDLVVLKSKSDEKREGATYAALAWTGLPDATTPRVFDSTAHAGFPAGLRTVPFRRPSWSEDGTIVFLGIGPWDEKPQPAKKETTNGDAAPPPDEEPASVDVWHSRDVEVMPRQRIAARTNRQRSYLSAWHPADGRFVRLATGLTEAVTPIRRTHAAYVADWTAYAMDRTIGRPAADLHLIDLDTGNRVPLDTRVDDGDVEASPGGRYILFFKADHYWTIDTKTRTMVNITRTAPTSFVNRESDATVKQKPPFGVAGWTTGDEAVVLYDKYDLWRVAADGSGATRLTDGAAEHVRHRYVRLNPDDEWIDLSKPLVVSLFGIWSKKSGYGHVPPGGRAAERLVWHDKMTTALARAKDADVFAYVVQAYDDSPDAFVGGAGLHDAKQVTKTNEHQATFAWGRSEVIEYTSERGDRLQAALFYPAGYEPGRKYPTVVYMYERLSDTVHLYSSPSERDVYNTSVFTSSGYLVVRPDIVFRPREPGLSVRECVEPAVKRVIAMGVADPARIGTLGHSWGGFDSAYLATHSTMFAASIAGAPITNLVSNYGSHHFSSGIAETDHIETGQQRMEVPLYEDLPAYIRNSAVYNIHNMKTPLLIMFGENDGTVFWHQGIEVYNIARRAKKDVVLLAYAGEDHGLRKKANQIDYQRRILQWFGHYLKHDPAASWITSGVSFLEREAELKRRKKT